MGSDLFGSFAESTVAALVVSGNSAELIKGANFLYPLVISAVGILVCLFSTFFTCAFPIKPNDEKNKDGKKKFWNFIKKIKKNYLMLYHKYFRKQIWFNWKYS